MNLDNQAINIEVKNNHLINNQVVMTEIEIAAAENQARLDRIQKENKRQADLQHFAVQQYCENLKKDDPLAGAALKMGKPVK